VSWKTRSSDGGPSGGRRQTKQRWRQQIVGAMQRQILCVWSRCNLFPFPLGLESKEG